MRIPLFALAVSVLAFPMLHAGQNENAPANTPLYRGDKPAYDRTMMKIKEGQNQRNSIKVIFDGDSITDAWERAGKEVWEKNFGKRIQAYDFAIGGDRTQNLIWRLDNGQLDGLHPRLVVLLIGTNNILNSPEEIASGVKEIVDQYRKRTPFAKILVLGIFPRGEKPDDGFRAKFKATNALLAKLADNDHVFFADIGEKFLQPDGTISKDVMGDFLHPTAKGYEIWAAAIKPYVDKYR
jgi:lysophospholipase L1-like esterase